MYIKDVDMALEDWDFKVRNKLPYEVKLSLTETRIIDSVRTAVLK